MEKSIIENIKTISHYNYESGKRTIIDNLLDAKWCEESDLIESFVKLSHSLEPSVITFFQLPFPVFLPSKWIKTGFKINTNYEIFFRIIGSFNNELDKNESFQVIKRKHFLEEDRYINGWIPNDYSGQLIRTQVLIFFNLWGYRYQLFNGYKNALERHKKANTIIHNPRVINPKTNTYFTIGSYESDILQRLKIEVKKIIENIIPIYSITAKQPIQSSNENLYNYFIMIQNGRIVVGGAGESMITNKVKSFQFSDYNKNLNDFTKFWSQRNKLSVYETYLVNAFNYIHDGLTNLAVVYSIMILEWFSFEIISNYYPSVLKKKINDTHLLNLIKAKTFRKKDKEDFRSPLIDRYSNYFPAIGIKIPSKYINKLRDIKNIRNSLVHKTKEDAISEKDAKAVVSLALEIINISMQQLNKDMC